MCSNVASFFMYVTCVVFRYGAIGVHRITGTARLAGILFCQIEEVISDVRILGSSDCLQSKESTNHEAGTCFECKHLLCGTTKRKISYMTSDSEYERVSLPTNFAGQYQATHLVMIRQR